LPPSQGGKYSGFGSAPPVKDQEGGKLPGFEDLQKDPVAALTKGFGWFTTTVGKTAKSVNEGYIQPTAAKVISFPHFHPHHFPSQFASSQILKQAKY
jgi:ADP-ribosylation factor GTPase-activating protein 1